VKTASSWVGGCTVGVHLGGSRARSNARVTWRVICRSFRKPCGTPLRRGAGAFPTQPFDGLAKNLGDIASDHRAELTTD
jgi:hypothetical protein